MTPLARTGYADSFARDHLPPPGRWPALEFTTDLLKYPERLNAAAELIDVPAAVYGPGFALGPVRGLKVRLGG